ncbi:hypothetical protein DFH06DRAFT_1225320 [Mycena polygramma]|nr:hypothetical protein DFH06DRAFT_1225320 [Mycena polygramma]
MGLIYHWKCVLSVVTSTWTCFTNAGMELDVSALQTSSFLGRHFASDRIRLNVFLSTAHHSRPRIDLVFYSFLSPMSFVSNVDDLTLGEGVYNNVHGNLNITHNNFYEAKRVYDDIGDTPNLLEPPRKRRREKDSDDGGLKIIRTKHLKLSLEIGAGPGYLLHAGEIKGRAVIVKVFDSAPNARERLESTVALSKELMHPNVLRMEGISSPQSLTHFIAYEDAHRKKAEVTLATALREDLTRSIALGFKMIAGLSSAMNYVMRAQGASPWSLGVENFDVLLDINDRFLISLNSSPGPSIENNTSRDQPVQDNTDRAWAVLNKLCERVLRSANRSLYDDINHIQRMPVLVSVSDPYPDSQQSAPASRSSPESLDSDPSQSLPENWTSMAVPPRREYVWCKMHRGQQSLANIANRIARDLDVMLTSSLRTVLVEHGEYRVHRCAGYVREEITLTMTVPNSALIYHDAPDPLEICSVCHEVVNVDEHFRCICGDPKPRSRPTVKCQTCRYWSHSDCVNKLTDFTCNACSGVEGQPGHALQYLHKVRARYAADPDINLDMFKRLLDILQTYQKEQKHIRDSQVYVEVRHLFRDAPKFLEECMACLPERLEF